MNIAVGCPIDRVWMMKEWFAAVDEAFYNLGEQPTFIFVCNQYDEEVLQGISENTKKARIVLVEERKKTIDHNWAEDGAYDHMVFLRNRLLESVREQGPEMFLSLDSDILLHPDSIKTMFPLLDKFDAVGGKCYMTTFEKHFPSFGILMPGGEMARSDETGTFQVDVLMAIKLMSRKAYDIDYEYHDYGEDIGWSKNCTNAGLRLGWTGAVCNKHVMHEKMLEPVDERVGF